MLNVAGDLSRFVESRSLTLKVVMNDVDLCVWVVDAQPGDSLVYHTGHLGRDREMHSEGYEEPVRRKIGELGNAAWMLCEENWIHLVQRRVSYGHWDYIAVRKAEVPKLKPVYRIIQSLAARGGKEKRPLVNEPAATVTATGPPT